MKIADIPAGWWSDHKRLTLIPKWHIGFWDGPLSGICVDVDSASDWYYVAGVFDPGDLMDNDNAWCAWKLSEEQKAYEIERHEAFEMFVGTHTSYNEDGERSGSLKPESEWDKYYKDPRWAARERYEERDFDAVCYNPFR